MPLLHASRYLQCEAEQWSCISTKPIIACHRRESDLALSGSVFKLQRRQRRRSVLMMERGAIQTSAFCAWERHTPVKRYAAVYCCCCCCCDNDGHTEKFPWIFPSRHTSSLLLTQSNYMQQKAKQELTYHPCMQRQGHRRLLLRYWWKLARDYTDLI